MLVEIQEDIFDNSDFQALRHLVSIIIYKGRYEVFVDITKVETSELYPRLDREDQEILQQSFVKFVQESSSPDVLVSERNEEHFSIDEAIRYLIQPVSIILENSQNDSHFLKVLFTHFDEKKIALQHLDEGWLRIENAGGATNIINFVTERLKSFDSLSKDNHHYMRAFVLIDSDTEYPGHVKKERVKIADFLNTHQVAYHSLEKREMENYLPDDIITSVDGDREFINAYLCLNPEQKDYFDIQRGFTQYFEELNSDVQELFGSLSENDKKLFRERTLNYSNFKKEFPKLFLSERVNKENLLARCVHHTYDPLELPNLVSKILKLL